VSYIYLQEQEGGSWEECSSDTPQFVLWKLNHIADEFCSKGNEMESYQSSQSGTMSQPSTATPGGEKSTSLQEDSHAKTSVVQEEEKDSTESEVDYGQKWQGSLAKYDPNTHSWKTHQCLLFEESTECLEIFPRWGMTQNGELYQLPIPAHLIYEKEYGSMPYFTPTARDYKGMSGSGLRKRHGAFHNLADCLGGVPNPTFSEWLMGWPLGWTDLKPLEMDKFQLWPQQHSDF
jgi:hypothetical protein